MADLPVSRPTDGHPGRRTARCVLGVLVGAAPQPARRRSRTSTKQGVEPGDIRRLVVVGVGTTPAATLFAAHAHAGNAALLRPGHADERHRRIGRSPAADPGRPPLAAPTSRRRRPSRRRPADRLGGPGPCAHRCRRRTAPPRRRRRRPPQRPARDRTDRLARVVGPRRPGPVGARRQVAGVRPGGLDRMEPVAAGTVRHLARRRPAVRHAATHPPRLGCRRPPGRGPARPRARRSAPRRRRAGRRGARHRGRGRRRAAAAGARADPDITRATSWRWSLPLRLLNHPDVAKAQAAAVAPYLNAAGHDAGAAATPPMAVGTRRNVTEPNAEPLARRDDPATADQWHLAIRMAEQVLADGRPRGRTAAPRARVSASRTSPSGLCSGWLWNAVHPLRDNPQSLNSPARRSRGPVARQPAFPPGAAVASPRSGAGDGGPQRDGSARRHRTPGRCTTSASPGPTPLPPGTSG